MNSRTLFMTLCLTLGISIQNCCRFDPAPEFFDISGMSLTHTDRNHSAIDTTSISFSDYGHLLVSFEVDYLAHDEYHLKDFSLMSSAYGCEPEVPGYSGSKEEAFDNITVITLRDFDDNHLAMDTINDVLAVNDYDSFRGTKLETFLIEKEDNVSTERLEFSFTAMPKLNQEFQVKIIVDLSTGESFEATSEAIFFKP